MNRPLRVAFLGTPSVAVPVLRELARHLSVQAVFTNPDRPAGRGRKVEPTPVKAAALELGIPVHQPERWRTEETRALWESLEIDLAVVVAYGHILPAWMLDSCRLGAWNLHFSLLPRWRGAAPVNHAILDGDPETGVALMAITPGLDAGPVVALSRRPITLEDTAEALLATLAEDAAGLLAEHLPSLLDGTVKTTVQDESGVTHASKLDKGMSAVDPGRSALALHRQVRALQPWPGVEVKVQDQLIKVLAVGGLKASGEPAGTLVWNKDGAWLTAGDGQALELVSLQRPGKPVQPAAQALQPLGASGKVRLV